MATVLGIESTCDETAAAVVIDGRRVASSVVATQVELHARYRGVVPEIASRAHIESILPVIREAVAEAGATLDEIDAIAVAHRPGLVGSLLIGVTAAKTLAWALGKPLIGVDHVHAHLYSVMLEEKLAVGSCQLAEKGDPSFSANCQLTTANFPAVGMVCSGGHTALYRLNSFLDVELVGTTIDDAVGEAYDKVSAILGLGYPGGPIIDRLAEQGDPKAIRFPRTLLDRDSLDFSFSGLKTSVLYHVRGHKGRERGPESLSPNEIANVAAGFQAACVDVITEKLRRAAAQFGAKSLILGGGVSANRGLRAAMSRFDLPTHFPAMKYCTDNAAMIAGLGNVLLENGHTSGLDLDAITFSQFVPT